MGRQRVQGQGPDRRGRRRRDPRRHRGAARRERRHRHRSPAAGRRGGRRPRRVVRPVRGVPAVRPSGPWTSRRSGPPTCASSSIRCGAPAPAGSAGCSPAGASPSTRSTRSATRTSAASTRSRSGPNLDESLAAIAGRRLRPRPVPRRRRGPGGRLGRGGDVHPPAPGHRPADVLPRGAPRLARPGRRERQQHVDGRAARPRTTASPPTRPRSGSSSSGRR